MGSSKQTRALNQKICQALAKWLKVNKNLNKFIEIGVDYGALEHNINVQFEIMALQQFVFLILFFTMHVMRLARR